MRSIFDSILLLLIWVSVFSSMILAQAVTPPTIDQIVSSKTDVITHFILQQPGGPSYDNILPLMTPVRWCTAQFRHFPVVLSAPLATIKGRIVSNGSVLNPPAHNPPTWKEAGRALSLFVGESLEPFGFDITRTSEGTWLNGWQPVWQVRYTAADNSIWHLEVFAPTDEPLASLGALAFRLTLSGPKPSRCQLRLASQDNANSLPVATAKKQAKPKSTTARSPGLWFVPLSGTPGLALGPAKPEANQQLLPGQSITALLFTRPLPPENSLGNYGYETLRQNCLDRWGKIFSQGTVWQIPEPRIQNAWKAQLVSIYMIASGNRPHYSAINAYDHLYMTECSDILRALSFFGHSSTALDLLGELMAFQRKDTRTAVAGNRLILLSDMIDLTRKSDLLTKYESQWKTTIDYITSNLDSKTGLPPPDRYAGDLGGAVPNLRSSALCWKGLRNLSLQLKNGGDAELASRLTSQAKTLQDNTLKALAESEKLYSDPDFVPIGFFGKDAPVDRIPDTQLSSYYNLVLGNVLETGILNADRESRIFRYLENRAGLSMGMPRTKPFWKNSPYFGQDGIAPLYSLSYALARMRRNQPDHALIMLYGWLAHGMTRDSFIHGEGVRFTGGDRHGRFFHLPPNAASAAVWLTILRYCLVADWDTNHDGTTETLRLLDTTPTAWLNHGQTIAFNNAITRFGPVSLKVESHLNQGKIQIKLDLPPDDTKIRQTTLRLRLPRPYRVSKCTIGTEVIPLDQNQRINLSGRSGSIQINVDIESPE